MSSKINSALSETLNSAFRFGVPAFMLVAVITLQTAKSSHIVAHQDSASSQSTSELDSAAMFSPSSLVAVTPPYLVVAQTGITPAFDTGFASPGVDVPRAFEMAQQRDLLAQR
jgi:hypothetical protein